MIGQIISMFIGIWLMASPAVLGHAAPARTHDWIIGPVVASLACIALWQVTRPLRWVNVVIGFWLLIAPWVMGYGLSAAGLNSMACGGLLALCSLHRGRPRHHFGDGWSELWSRA